MRRTENGGSEHGVGDEGRFARLHGFKKSRTSISEGKPKTGKRGDVSATPLPEYLSPVVALAHTGAGHRGTDSLLLWLILTPESVTYLCSHRSSLAIRRQPEFESDNTYRLLVAAAITLVPRTQDKIINGYAAMLRTHNPVLSSKVLLDEKGRLKVHKTGANTRHRERVKCRTKKRRNRGCRDHERKTLEDGTVCGF